MEAVTDLLVAGRLSCVEFIFHFLRVIFFLCKIFNHNYHWVLLANITKLEFRRNIVYNNGARVCFIKYMPAKSGDPISKSVSFQTYRTTSVSIVD